MRKYANEIDQRVPIPLVHETLWKPRRCKCIQALSSFLFSFFIFLHRDQITIITIIPTAIRFKSTSATILFSFRDDSCEPGSFQFRKTWKCQPAKNIRSGLNRRRHSATLEYWMRVIFLGVRVAGQFLPPTMTIWPPLTCRYHTVPFKFSAKLVVTLQD